MNISEEFDNSKMLLELALECCPIATARGKSRYQFKDVVRAYELISNLKDSLKVYIAERAISEGFDGYVDVDFVGLSEHLEDY